MFETSSEHCSKKVPKHFKTKIKPTSEKKKQKQSYETKYEKAQQQKSTIVPKTCKNKFQTSSKTILKSDNKMKT